MDPDDHGLRCQEGGEIVPTGLVDSESRGGGARLDSVSVLCCVVSCISPWLGMRRTTGSDVRALEMRSCRRPPAPMLRGRRPIMCVAASAATRGP